MKITYELESEEMEFLKELHGFKKKKIWPYGDGYTQYHKEFAEKWDRMICRFKYYDLMERRFSYNGEWRDSLTFLAQRIQESAVKGKAVHIENEDSKELLTDKNTK